MLQLFCVIAENFRKQKHAVWCLLMDARFALLSKRHNNVTCKAGLSQRQKKGWTCTSDGPKFDFLQFLHFGTLHQAVVVPCFAGWNLGMAENVAAIFFLQTWDHPTLPVQWQRIRHKKNYPPTCWILLTHLDMNSRQNMLKWMWHDVSFLDMLVYCSIFNTVL